MKLSRTNLIAPRPALRLGFVPLTDCAPLVMAHELGLFRKYGVRALLSRELGWATIRDKIIHGELDAAHAVAGMPVAATLGLKSVRCDCVTALVLNLHGNAITLSRDLWRAGVHDGATLCQEIRRARRKRPFTFGAVYSFSSHYYLLRNWLTASGVDPDRDARIVIVPPPQMVLNLKAGHLDGFCVGEPWNSVAVQTGAGWCAAVSAELDPGHPEKVLMVRRDFAEKRSDEHLALVAALLDACEFCDAPANREQLISVLARPEYVGVAESTLRRGIYHELDFGNSRVRAVPDFNIFYRDDANEPTAGKAAWVIRHLRDAGPIKTAAADLPLGRRVFRTDLFESAVRLRTSTPQTHESGTQTKNQLTVA
jgi:ABC-type nitrate/sulfonate/bicarbonate transport system substrate-binding protein